MPSPVGPGTRVAHKKHAINTGSLNELLFFVDLQVLWELPMHDNKFGFVVSKTVERESAERAQRERIESAQRELRESAERAQRERRERAEKIGRAHV